MEDNKVTTKEMLENERLLQVADYFVQRMLLLKTSQTLRKKNVLEAAREMKEIIKIGYKPSDNVANMKDYIRSLRED